MSTYIDNLSDSGVDVGRIANAKKMLSREDFALYSQMTGDTLFGVVRSQSNPNLIYACHIRADGSFGCHTQKLNPCGGLRGKLCKHIIVLLGFMAETQPEVRGTLMAWVHRSLNQAPANHAKRESRYILDTYIDATHLPVSQLNTNINPVLFRTLENVELWRPRSTQSTARIIEPNTPLIESHVSVRDRATSTEALELAYVICMGDRVRVTHQEAIENAWQECKVCHQWLCSSCQKAFLEVGGNCPSAFSGHPEHKLSFI